MSMRLPNTPIQYKFSSEKIRYDVSVINLIYNDTKLQPHSILQNLKIE